MHFYFYVAAKIDETPVQRLLWTILCCPSARASQTLSWTSTWYEIFHFIVQYFNHEFGIIVNKFIKIVKPLIVFLEKKKLRKTKKKEYNLLNFV